MQRKAVAEVEAVAETVDVGVEFCISCQWVQPVEATCMALAREQHQHGDPNWELAGKQIG